MSSGLIYSRVCFCRYEKFDRKAFLILGNIWYSVIVFRGMYISIHLISPLILLKVSPQQTRKLY